jgi:anaerobic selenocysteine-containing dehydrogenase
VAAAYAKSNATIVTYGMGITQHNKGTSNVRLIADLLLMRGNIGKPGAGICPLRGHSNVQGNRTVGITEKPRRLPREAAAGVWFTPPQHHGHDAVKALQAMIDGESKALLCLGGNFAVAMPDPNALSRRCAGWISACTSAPSSTARICWWRKRPLFCRVWAAPSWICRRPAGSRSPSKIRCRWCTPRRAS